MQKGHMGIIKILLADDSDPFAVDYSNATVFTILAKWGLVYCMHFMYMTIRERYSSEAAFNLLNTLDSDGHSVLDWAADTGDVNCIENLIRRGIDPFRLDAQLRGPLHWAVKSNRVHAAAFLVKCGCDPDKVDSEGVSPRMMAVKKKNTALVAAANEFTEAVWVSVEKDWDAQGVMGRCYWYDKDGTTRSKAITRINKSRLSFTLLYGTLVAIMWFAAICTPFYAWLVVVAGGAAFIRYNDSIINKTKGDSEPDDYEALVQLNALQRLLAEPERQLGFYVGSFAGIVFYWSSCLSLFLSRQTWEVAVSAGYSAKTRGASGFALVSSPNPLGIGGISSGEYGRGDVALFLATGIFLFLSLLSWVKIAWLDKDPGIIDTRKNDFEDILNEALVLGTSPPSSLYCRTTLVRKPLRSKYCTNTGCVIARMDHYCIWLNNSIGYRNHRTFIIFLLLHVISLSLLVAMIASSLKRELFGSDACITLVALFGREYFFVVVMCGLAIVSLVGIGALFVDQLVNISANITVNEKINRSRYPWMLDDHGLPCNRFNRGIVVNTLEFWGLFGCAVDYTKTFDMPANGLLRSQARGGGDYRVNVLHEGTFQEPNVARL